MAAISPQTAFLPISMSSPSFPMFGLMKPPPIGRIGNEGSLGTLDLKLFLERGMLEQNISLKFSTTPLLYGFAL
uniref:Uncharacterized protein n=1 Tax=Rhizophora mucronata TaxID=61149 RepID=A0A2P2Q6G9_RHIMU